MDLSIELRDSLLSNGRKRGKSTFWPLYIHILSPKNPFSQFHIQNIGNISSEYCVELIHSHPFTEPHDNNPSAIFSLPADIFVHQNLDDSFPAALIPQGLRIGRVEAPELHLAKRESARQELPTVHPVSDKLASFWNMGAAGVLALGFMKAGLAGLTSAAATLAGPHLLAIAVVGAAYVIEEKVRKYLKSRSDESVPKPERAAA